MSDVNLVSKFAENSTSLKQIDEEVEEQSETSSSQDGVFE